MASNHSDSSPGAFASHSNNHQQTSHFEPSASGSKTTQFLVEFQPCDYSVICGRGKSSFNHVGNRRFRLLSSMFIEKYSQADTRLAKSAIVTEIINVIREVDGHFWRFKGGAWFEVGYDQARDKVGACLRDLLHTQYRSSSKAKMAIRANVKAGNRKENQSQHSYEKLVDDTQLSDDSSTSSTSSTSSSSWGSTKDSLGFEYWLEKSEDFFVIDVF
jgi:hypothetical protein